MIKSNALYLVVVVSLVVAVVCSSVIFLSFYKNYHFLNYVRQNKLIRNCNSAVNILLSEKSDINSPMDLFGEGSDSVYISQRQWGALEFGAVKAVRDRDFAERFFLIGTNVPVKYQSAILLEEQNNPLRLGKASVVGDCFLPESGFRTDLSFLDPGSAKIDGDIYKSPALLPGLKDSFYSDLVNVKEYFLDNSIIEPISSAENLPGINSFADTTIVLHSDQPLIISKPVKGNCVIISESNILFTSECEVEDIIAIAPTVLFESGFSGALQVFASDSIIAESNTNLYFPSVLTLINNKPEVKNARITLKRNSNFKGTLISFSQASNLDDPVFITQSGVSFEGVAFVKGKVVAKGSFEGNITCKEFILEKGDCKNCITEASINARSLSSHFLVPDMFESSKHKEVLKWLY